MQPNPTIRIDMNLNDAERRTLQSSIQDLSELVNHLGFSFQMAQSD